MWTDVPWSARWVTVGSLHRARLPLVPLYYTVHILRLPCIPWYPMSHREIEITDISRYGTDRRVLGTWRSAKRGPAHATPYYVYPLPQNRASRSDRLIPKVPAGIDGHGPEPFRLGESKVAIRAVQKALPPWRYAFGWRVSEKENGANCSICNVPSK